MSNRPLLIALVMPWILQAADPQIQSRWNGKDRWIGPDWWANPMTDWQREDGSVIAAASKNRSLCLLTGELGMQGTAFVASVQLEILGDQPAKARFAGFRIGRRGGIDDYRHVLVHATDWLDATIREDGKLRLVGKLSNDRLPLNDGPVTLQLRGKLKGENVVLTLSAVQGDKSAKVQTTVSSAAVFGGIALLADGPPLHAGGEAARRFRFSRFKLSGDMLSAHPERAFGPILWTQYSLSQNQLRLQAQMAPLGPRFSYKPELWIAGIAGQPQWAKVGLAPMDKLSRTATFTVDDWPADSAVRYEVRMKWRGEQFVWPGQIRREPGAEEPLKLGCFSCDNGYLFPIPAMVEQVKRQDPDMLYFAGDQIYESYGGFGTVRKNTEIAMIDFLRKYYQFGWTWRELLRDRPSVILPDDHDVFQGNLWGHGGRTLPKGKKANDWAQGGYRMPGDWINAVERIHVGHLPDPAATMKLRNGLKSYFTSLTYGGVGFAILEDRKFKTGPLSLPEAQRRDGDGASLLGGSQEAFLALWSKDWRNHQMKCALSQTIFCTAATHTGHSLKRSRNYYDSGAWPKAARNRAVRILGDCNALAIHGDQHLGVLLRQGIDDFDDAGYAFMVPGTANGFPRAWWPGVDKGLPEPGQDFTGKYRDDAGHPIQVLAVGNPEPGSNSLPKTTDPMEIGYRKGSGYGMVEFNKKDGSVIISLYRLGNAGEMFPGFPKTIRTGGKPR